MINAAIVGLGWWGKVLVQSVQNKSDKIRFTAGAVRTPSKVADFAETPSMRLSTRPPIRAMSTRSWRPQKRARVCSWKSR
jgi:hypothetical protein